MDPGHYGVFEESCLRKKGEEYTRRERYMWREAVWEKMDWIFHIHGERAREKKRVWKTTTFFFLLLGKRKSKKNWRRKENNQSGKKWLPVSK